MQPADVPGQRGVQWQQLLPVCKELRAGAHQGVLQGGWAVQEVHDDRRHRVLPRSQDVRRGEWSKVAVKMLMIVQQCYPFRSSIGGKAL